jgi:hypothetical protein
MVPGENGRRIWKGYPWHGFTFWSNLFFREWAPPACRRAPRSIPEGALMSSHHTLRNGVVVTLLLALLAVAGAPVQARTLRPAVERISRVAGLGERLWHFLVSLWPRDLSKEGMSIDPNGDRVHEGTSIDPNGERPQEGVTIDPDGHS